RNNSVLRERRRIERPAVGNDLLQFQEIFFAQLALPEFAKRLHPEKREPHFLFEERLDRRGDFHGTIADGVEERGDAREIRQVEQLEEPVNVSSRFWLVGFRIDDAPWDIGRLRG